MLGEAAMTFADAERYRASYAAAIAGWRRRPAAACAPARASRSSSRRSTRATISSTPRPRKAALVPIVRELALAASAADIHFTIDAEEAERLELSLDIIEALVADDALFANGWQGFGLALQAYQKRAVPLCEWVAALARRHNRRLMVRLVKGAYWDSEIKLSRSAATPTTRCSPARSRPTSRTSPAPPSCSPPRTRSTRPSPPTTPTRSARSRRSRRVASSSSSASTAWARTSTRSLAEAEGDRPTRVRIYAPVGGHKDLLAYLVRRLLENGANSSFVNRMADADVPVAALVTDPVADLAALEPQAQPVDPAPRRHLSQPPQQRRDRPRRSDGARAAAGRAGALASREWAAAPTALRRRAARPHAIRSPQDSAHVVGQALDATPADVDLMLARAEAAQPAWDALGGTDARALLIKASDLFEATRRDHQPVPARGRQDADRRVLELREAVDFLRYYACEARMLFSRAAAAARPDRRAEPAAPPRPRGVRHDQPVELPAGDLHRHGLGRARRGQHGDRQARRADPADRRARGPLCHEAGIPTTCSSSRPATARSAPR
jgi:RHH-type proline utilization regulon transcriptional repressor/proline dehydrogenase/delta 1-pyrroline-5-carboxylate dehydrogenase